MNKVTRPGEFTQIRKARIQIVVGHAYDNWWQLCNRTRKNHSGGCKCKLKE